jgi:hypothetical protein
MLAGQTIDYFPSQLDFLPARKKRLCEELNLPEGAIEQWTDNHFYYVYPLSAAEYYSSGSPEDWEKARLAISLGLVHYDEKEAVLFDNWGGGLEGKSQWSVANYSSPGGKEGMGGFSSPRPQG